MNLFALFATLVVYLLLNQPQTPSASERMMSLERRAVADTQRMLAFDLDSELPKSSFAAWFEKVAGPGAGVVWQLSECGEAEANDLRACVEANALLPDGRRVIVAVAVGTFKRGLIGAPTFYFGVIEKGRKLTTIRRLRDLPNQLSAPGSLTNRPVVRLPEAHMPRVELAANNVYVAVTPAWGVEEFGHLTEIEELPPPALQPRTEPAQLKAAPSVDKRGVSEGAQGSVIIKAEPTYPPGAEKFNASGRVEVRVTISETGRVKNAVAISGHLLLRDAAVRAARKWVFTPTTVDGVPVETQIVLTFDFKK
jgi:TonB family protein